MMNVDDYADRIRGIINAENTIENNRMTWLLIIQGLLFASLSNLISGPSPNLTIVSLLAILGVLMSLSALLNLIHGRAAIHGNAKRFLEKFPAYDGPPVIGLDPNKLNAVNRFYVPPFALPSLFTIGWAVVLLLVFLGRIGPS